MSTAVESELVDAKANTSCREEHCRRDVRELVYLLSKLNPAAQEFVPSFPACAGGLRPTTPLFNEAPVCVSPETALYYGVFSGGSYYYYGNGGYGGSTDNQQQRKDKRRDWNNKGRRIRQRVRRAQKEIVIRRTVYVADIDQNVTEEELAHLFSGCGQIEDCRVCGDPHSTLRFAFIEFAEESGAIAALDLSGTILGVYPLKVLPSKTAILPVNPSFLPKSDAENEMCSRTIYCTNIDRKITQTDVKNFFESTCGEVSRLRLLGDHTHSTRIAFVEFVLADSAVTALNCSGMVLGSLPIRVNPSKTPVRPRATRATP